MSPIQWNDSAPIYRQLKERVIAMMLDGELKPGDALPYGKTVMLFDNVPRSQLAGFGEMRTPGLADLFVATMKGTYA